MATTVVITRRHNALDPSISVEVFTYGWHVVEVMHIGRYGCIVYDATRYEWVSDPSEYLTPLCAQLLALETLGVVDV